jgi:hypothetical protein
MTLLSAKGVILARAAGRTMTAGARGQDGAVRYANSHVKEPPVASRFSPSLEALPSRPVLFAPLLQPKSTVSQGHSSSPPTRSPRRDGEDTREQGSFAKHQMADTWN